MRSAMIGVSIVLAIILAWSFIFDGDGPSKKSSILPKEVQVAAPIIKSQTKKAAKAGMEFLIPVAAAAGTGSCAHHYAQAVKNCDGDDSCKKTAGNNWDLCDATGVWPK